MPTRTTRRALTALAALALLGAAPSRVQAQSTIERLSTELVRLMGENNLSKRAERDGGLHEGEAMELLIEVSSGRDVVVAGICDDDCSDLDLRVSKDGTMLGEDILEDDAPMVRLQNFGGGTLKVRVEMPSCSVAPCAFRVMVFAR